MYDDIVLNLREGVKLNTLTVAPDFDRYDPVLQRAVVLLLTSSRPELILDGMSLSQNIVNSTSNLERRSGPLSSFYADALKRLLNAEDSDVSAVEMAINTEGSTVTITINITKADGAEIGGKFSV